MFYILPVLALLAVIYLVWHRKLIVASIKTQISLYEARYGTGDEWRERVWGKNDAD
jgi:hypothetical protein